MRLFNNINAGFSRGRVATEEARANANDGIKKSSGMSFDKGVKQLGTGLMRGLRNAATYFNPAALSSKVHDFNPDAMAQSTAFVRDKVTAQDQKVQERMKNARGAQAPHAYAGSGAGRPQMSTHADRQNKTSNAAPPQSPNASGTREQKRFSALSDDFVKHFNKVNAEMRAGGSRPQVKAQQEKRQTSNVTHHRPQSINESPKMSEAEARNIVERGVDYDSSPADHAQLRMAEKRLAEIQERKESDKLQKKIDNALNPGGKNTRVSPMHVRQHQEQKECERILQQQPHYDMSDAQRSELWASQKSAQKKLDKLERFAVFDNAERARTEKMTLLQGAMFKVESALNNLNKRDLNHRDFDGDLLGLPNAAQLAKRRADLENKLANLKLDFDLTGCESTVARWTHEMESGKKAPREDAVNNVLDTLIDVSQTGKMLNQSSDDSIVTRTRLQNIAQQIEKIKREL